MALTPQVLVGVTSPTDDITELIDDLQWSSASPGGFASCSFTVPGGGLVKKQNLLREGNKVWVRDGAVNLWEGVIVNHPFPGTFGDGDEAVVECGGLLSIAKNAEDFCRTWSDADFTQWQPTKPNNQWYTFDNESRLYMCAEARDAGDGSIPSGYAVSYYYWVDGGAKTSADTGGGVYAFSTDDDIDHLEFDADYDLGSNFTCRVQTSSSPWGTWADDDGAGGDDWWVETDSDATETSLRAPAAGSFPANTRAVRFKFGTHSAAAVSADRFLNVTNLTVFRADAAVTIDAAMADVANDTGLASSTTNTAIGSARPLVIRPFTTRAAALEELAAMHTAPVDWGFWDDSTFSVAARISPPTDPIPLADHYVVQASDAGMTWDVTKRAEGAPDYVRVIFLAKDVSPYPDGTQVTIMRPDPSASPTARIVNIEFTEYPITVTQAQYYGDQYFAWYAASEYEGSVTVTGTITRVDGTPVPAAHIRAGQWIECLDIIGHEPLYITQVEYDAASEQATLTIGESPEFKFRTDYEERLRTWRPHGPRPPRPFIR